MFYIKKKNISAGIVSWFLILLSPVVGITVAMAQKFSNAFFDYPFVQEYHQCFLLSTDEADANDVKSVAIDKDNTVWAATQAGLYSKLPGATTWSLIIDGPDQGPAYDVALDPNGIVWAATWNGVYAIRAPGAVHQEGPEPPITHLVATREGIYALGPKGIWQQQEQAWKKRHFSVARSIRDACTDRHGGLWIGTDVGLYHVDDDTTLLYQNNEDLISAYVHGLDVDAYGNLWAGGLGGITIRKNGIVKGYKTPADGIPNAWVQTVCRAPDSTMWVGTRYGIVRYKPGERAYSVRVSRRWLINNDVRDITFDMAGNAWIATAGGISMIGRRDMTLAQKAGYYYRQLLNKNVRNPWIIGHARLEVPGDTATAVPDDDDNDGEYNSMYLAMESFRYAATGNAEAAQRARQAFDFLQRLQTITGTDGFFARTFIPASWTRAHDMNRSYTPQELAEELVNNPRSKPVEVRWHLTPNGEWKWKGDTSSDELCGHLFGYFWYYTLVADHAEKARITAHFCKIMDHLMAHDYNLTDVDGSPTKWGVWSPKQLNHDPDWAPERALNSLELLSFLKFAYHLSGDEKYQHAYLKLINEEGYLNNATMLAHPNPAWETYFDIYLQLYVLPPLVTYETDPALKSAYAALLTQWFHRYKNTGSPFVNFTYNLLDGGHDELDASITFLKDVPLDLVDWRIDNSKREDLQVGRKPILESLQASPLRPPSEYRTMRWDKNPYLAVSGNPSQLRDPVFWLLPYWMGRYLGLIMEKE